MKHWLIVNKVPFSPLPAFPLQDTQTHSAFQALESQEPDNELLENITQLRQCS